MTINFDIEKQAETPFGTVLIGRFMEQPPYFASDQKFKLGKFEFELWGVPRKGIWTLKLVTDTVFNEAMEEQVVVLDIL
ncbi:MAG: hypothetical protein U5L45_21215 [Saprospiraceae bacterium]|nr:hypothetical protein [Saprospiraceae bacterium]